MSSHFEQVHTFFEKKPLKFKGEYLLSYLEFVSKSNNSIIKKTEESLNKLRNVNTHKIAYLLSFNRPCISYKLFYFADSKA